MPILYWGYLTSQHRGQGEQKCGWRWKGEESDEQKRCMASDTVPMFLIVVQRALWNREKSREEQRELAKVFVDFSKLFRKEALHTFTLLEFCQSPVFNGQHHLKCHLRVHKLANIFSKNATFWRHPRRLHWIENNGDNSKSVLFLCCLPKIRRVFNALLPLAVT